MENTAIANPLATEKPSRLLKKFALPSIVAMLVSSLYNIVDQIFIGNGVGYLGNAATNVAYPFTTICLAISLLIGVGGAAYFSLELGRQNTKEAESCVGSVIWMAGILGISLFIIIELFAEPMLNAFGATSSSIGYALDYARITAIGMPFLIFTNAMSNLIRADGSPNYSMLCMVIGAVINTILDPIFIFVFKLEVAGAAWATIISQFISFTAAFAYIGRFKHIRLSRGSFRFKLKKSLHIASLGLSNSLNQIAITLVQIVMNNSLTYYGNMSVYGSDIPLSAAGIVIKINAIFLSVIIGLAQGSLPIISFNYGARQYDRVKSVYKLAVFCSTVFSTLGFIVFQVFPEYIISLFGSGDELYMKFAVRFMRIFLFMIFINGVQVLSSNFFSAIGKPIKGVILSLSRQFFILIPMMLILPLVFDPQIDGILYSGPVADFIAFILSVVLIRIEFKKMSAMQTTVLDK